MNIRFTKLLLTLLLTVAVAVASAAEKVTFEASSPLIVRLGSNFLVEFSLNAKPDDESFKAPSFENFDILAGPSVSRGQSMQIINGEVSRSVNYTYSFVLLPREAGNFKIGAAEVEVDGATYRTKPLLVEIVDEGQAPNGNRQPNAGGAATAPDRPTEEPAAANVEDMFLRTVVSRSSLYKNEPLHVLYKLYFRVPVNPRSYEAAPSFNGFWSQRLDAQRTPSRETYNGRVYDTYVVDEYLLYPQQTGQLTVDQLVINVDEQRRRTVNGFFGPETEVYTVPRKVASHRVTVNVKPLPAGAPASFSGAVGNFTMESVLPSESLAANSAATVTVKISGTGNLTFVQAPKLELPGSFEQYNVKTTESINTSVRGISGYRQFEYPFIARAEGSYDMAPVEFTYFNPARMEYVTLRSKPLVLEITPDGRGGSDAVVMQGRGMSKEEVKLLGQDIRFIKLGAAQLRTERRPFMFGTVYWTLLALVLATFGITYAALRKRIRESKNVALVRGRRANKVAVQRFRAARRYMEEQNRHAFYEEMLRALWGYMSDKFNIPVANLTKESVREELHRRGASAEEAQRFTAIIACCDEAQYSPASAVRMSDVYTEGVDLISRIETTIKR